MGHKKLPTALGGSKEKGKGNGLTWLWNMYECDCVCVFYDKNANSASFLLSPHLLWPRRCRRCWEWGESPRGEWTMMPSFSPPIITFWPENRRLEKKGLLCVKSVYDCTVVTSSLLFLDSWQIVVCLVQKNWRRVDSKITRLKKRFGHFFTFFRNVFLSVRAEVCVHVELVIFFTCYRLSSWTTTKKEEKRRRFRFAPFKPSFPFCRLDWDE